MPFFKRDRGTENRDQRNLYALYELAYTAADVFAALLFLVGSFLFFDDTLKVPAIWCFVIGSAFFAVKPILRIVREIHLAAVGDVNDLAQRYRG